MKSQPPLIAHVVYHFGTGGMENGLVNLINHLPPGRYRHAIVSLTGHTEFRRRIRSAEVGFYDLDKRPGHDLGWYRRLARLIEWLKPAIVHTRNLNALEAQFVAAWLRVPGRVHGEHGRDVFDLEGRNWKYNLLRRAARPLVHRYIAVSRDLARWLTDTVGVNPHKLSQIYNGVDSQRFHPRAGERPDVAPAGFFAGAQCVIGSVGRLAAVKDYPSLIRAYARARDLLPQAQGLRLILVGDGPQRAHCEALIRSLGLADSVWLAGERDDIPRLMQAMDVFVLPSLGEGISNTLLEAMATGLPVIASRVGGNPELVEEGVGGSLFPAADVERLAGLLAAYATDPGRRQREGAAARARVEAEFSLERMAAAYQSVYDDLLAYRRRQPEDGVQPAQPARRQDVGRA
ncbi:MAG: TIGR03088 family PEP-CTERM/XrtA system glycosyltransferase [Burkholderiales bacterium]|nr:TIGR03088 family PEP-CTERM/XrtA system glycosyltransferase [Burkholderiales bacterium]